MYLYSYVTIFVTNVKVFKNSRANFLEDSIKKYWTPAFNELIIIKELSDNMDQFKTFFEKVCQMSLGFDKVK